MDPQPPNVPEVPAPPEMPQNPKDSHGITIAAMAIFVLLSLAAVAFLYYQNRQLKSMLASYQQVQATPAPVTSPTPSIDISNWKTYTNDAYGFSFKYPGNDWDYSQTNFAGSLNTYKFASRGNKLITFNIAIDSSWSGKGGIEKTQPNSSLGGLPAYRISNPAGQNPPSEIVYVENKGKVLTIDLNYQDQSSLVQEFNQILSTFKFINPTASPSAKPVACTQEAKICPDGSSVGRTGPNCEFAPCPTP